MKQLNISDDFVIKGILSSDDSVLRYLYKECNKMILSLVTRNNGYKEDAEEILHDGIIVFYEKVKNGNLNLTCSIKTYIYSICRNLWLNELKDKSRFVEIDENYIDNSESGKDINEFEKNNNINNTLNDIINDIGESCKKILLFFYYEKLSMEEISKRLGLSGADYAKTQKYRCLSKLREKYLSKINYKNAIS